jgi:hypothetical protein
MAGSEEYAELLEQEMAKMFANQSHLKELIIEESSSNNIIFAQFSGMKDCSINLSELICHSNNHSEIFHQLSQICCNIQSLTIALIYSISNGLKDLISSQKNLKCLTLQDHLKNSYWADIIPHIMKHSNSLVKVTIGGIPRIGDGKYRFISTFKNLRELVFSHKNRFGDLIGVVFPQLQILKFQVGTHFRELDSIIDILKNNGENLKEIHVDGDNDLVYSAISKFCPNLKSMFISIMHLQHVKMIVDNCQQLESVKTSCPIDLKGEGLKYLVKFSKNFHELKLIISSPIPSLDWELFLAYWKSHNTQKSLSLIIHDDYKNYNIKSKNGKIIEKYKSLGVIKKFEIVKYIVDEDF